MRPMRIGLGTELGLQAASRDDDGERVPPVSNTGTSDTGSATRAEWVGMAVMQAERRIRRSTAAQAMLVRL